jgi:hypothetical protein
MTQNYIDSLPVNSGDKELLRSLGADSPSALMGILDSSHDYFEERFGKKKLEELTAALSQQMSVGEHAIFKEPKKDFGIGAIVDRPAPTLEPPRFDISKRRLAVCQTYRAGRPRAHPRGRTADC